MKKPSNNNHKKVFVPRYTSEEHFPKERGIYFIDNPGVRHVAYYEKGLGFVKNQWSKDKVPVQWWLEEKEFPTPKQIESEITDILEFAHSHSDVARKISKLIEDSVLVDSVRD